MKVWIKNGEMCIAPETDEETDELNEWYERNPVSKDDGIKMCLYCLR